MINEDISLDDAVRNGDFKIIKALLQKGINVNIIDEDNQAPLHIAAKYRDTKIVLLLLNHGADVNIIDSFCETPLHRATRMGKTDIVKILIEKGADVNIKDKNDETPLHTAATYGSTEIGIVLIEKGADVNAKDKNRELPLHKAAKFGNLETVKILLERDADINAKDRFGETSLIKSIMMNNIEIGIVLIEKGADVNAGDHWDRTPIHRAARLNSTEIIKALIQKGADVNAKNFFGKTPLYKAVCHKNSDAVITLLEHGADANTRTKTKIEREGITLLYIAVWLWGNTKIIKALIEKGADVNAKNFFGKTPLHEAAEDYCVKKFLPLLVKGANVNAKDNNGNTPIYYAIENNNLEIAKLLLENGADISGKYGEKLIHAAIKLKLNNIFEDLIKAQLVDALYECIKEDFDQVIKLFSEYSRAEDIFNLPRLKYFFINNGIPINFHEFTESLDIPEKVKSDLKSYKIATTEDLYNAIEEDILCLFNSFGANMKINGKEENIGFMRLSEIHSSESLPLYTDEKKRTLKIFYENMPDNIYTVEGFFIGLINNNKEVIELLSYDPYIMQNIFNKLDKLIFNEDIEEGIKKTIIILEEDLHKVESNKFSKKEAFNINNNNSYTDKVAKKENFISR